MTVACPRCRADRAAAVEVDAPRGTCPGCGTDWERGPLGEMISRGRS